VLWAGHAAAIPTTLTLSQQSSDATPAELLDAHFDFVVAGDNTAKTLTITVTNDTVGIVDGVPDVSDAYNINEIFFNASSDVGSLSLASASHSAAGDVLAAWSPLNTDVSGAGVFGEFDYGLGTGGGQLDPDLIGPQESIAFLFDITAADLSLVDETDFTTILSTNPPGSVPSLIQAKFVNGAGDDSAFGATQDEEFPPIPEPGSALLLASGLLGLGLAGARRHTRK
jgi:hypothetical protein